MYGFHPTEIDELLLPLMQKVDAACVRFEKAWKAGQQPRIEDFAAEFGDRDQLAIL